MEKHDFFRHESLQDRQSIKKYLKAVTDGIAKGALSLADNSNAVTLNPDGLIRLNVEVRGERERRELLIALGWREPSQDHAEDSGALIISAD